MRWICAGLLCLITPPVFSQQEIPKAADPRLTVELVAAAPDIVHPIACDFDAKGRLLVVESHTHFAPQGYKGPKFDRIRAFAFKVQGRPSLGFQPTTFFEGTRHTMDLAVHPDGSVYVATRNEILRLRDTKGTGVADEKTRIVFLDTKGDYPHNGLSGLCFDSRGNLIFGMGENLGAAYKLIGSDDKSFSGQGDGGHIFTCSADGKNLRRIATGFWNPFGNCRDIYGRLFCVDNDPDQAPPCRMLHVVEGGDYGFRFMYGRSGKHPFQSWHGELPGTLPMMTGVGEAPCEILSYESDGLPKEYLGQLLVTSWADHRVERYQVKPHGASFKAERLPFVQGGNNFRPTGMCVAPDGSLFVADWVLSNYTLHGKGAIWHIRWKDAPKVERPGEPEKAILSLHRPLREAMTKRLAGSEDGQRLLRKHLENAEVRVRAGALDALYSRDRDELRRDFKAKLFTNQQLLAPIIAKDAEPGMRELAMETLGLSSDTIPYLAGKHSAALMLAAVLWGDILGPVGNPKLVGLFAHDDPFLRHAAVYRLGQQGVDPAWQALDAAKLRQASQRVSRLLVDRNLACDFNRFQSSRTFATTQASEYLRDPDETMRFLAVKWIADEKLENCYDAVAKTMQDPKLSVRMYLACATALARLDGQEVSETKLADYFAKRLSDDKTPAALRVQLLKQVPTTHKALTLDLLIKLIRDDDAVLRLEAMRALVESSNPQRSALLVDVLRRWRPAPLRAHALLGLTDRPRFLADEIINQTAQEVIAVRREALRALIGIELSEKQRARVTELAERGVDVDFLVERALGRPFFKDRPPAKDTDAWLKRLEGKADAESGERIFFHPKVGMCARCHRIDGRGQDVGPDLSGIGRTERRAILESILQPSNNVAPHYQVWSLELHTGKVMTGTLIHTNLDEYTFLDSNGGRFKVKTGDIALQAASTASIMPDGLVDRMTDQEVRDLLVYLQSRK